jgi:hypothetical protein
MAEEVNSKAPAASSTANRLGVPSQNRWKDVDVRPGACAAGSGDAFAMSPDCGSSYRGIGLRSAEWGSTKRARLFGHLRLAQNDKGKSEDDGRGDHGSELGK